ncbi:hypothetical protein ABPG72_003039 [Tetrahymena utriculariae]
MEGESKLSNQGKDQRYKNVVFYGKRKYSGQFLNGKRDGKGREEDKTNHTLYEGYFQDDMYHGEGILYQEQTKCYFKGIFEKNQKKAGIEIFPNGDVYEGQYKDDKFHGKGYLRNGDLFYFIDDGKSVQQGKDQNKVQSTYSYEGTFQNGKKDGFGTERYIKGAVYVGEFRNNQKHGKGKLQYPDGSYYEGDFVNGVPCGFGVHCAYSVEQIQSIKPIKKGATTNKTAEQLQRNIQLTESLAINSLQDIDSNQQLILKQEEQENQDYNYFDEKPEFYYEGEFMEGFKHGKGRLYFPDGSYYYCEWAFNTKIKEIVYYDAPANKHCIFTYDNIEKVLNHFYKPNLQDPNIVGAEMRLGYPPNDRDGFKQIIDSCAINGDQFEDDEFKQVEQNMNYPDSGSSKRANLDIEFLKLKDNHNFYEEGKDLFVYPIQANTIVYNQLSDYQLVTCIEALSQFPHIFFKIFSVRYDLADIGFIFVKLYINGQWQDIIVDDVFPFYDQQQDVIFSTTVLKELGYLVLQKAFCKIQNSYFGHKHDTETQKAEDYFQMLSGLPCKSLVWENDIDEDQKTNIKKLVESNSKCCKVAYLQERFSRSREIDIPQNYPFIILEVLDLGVQQQQLNPTLNNTNSLNAHTNENLFLILKSIDSNFSFIKRRCEEKISFSKHNQVLKEIIQKYTTIPDNFMDHYTSLKESNNPANKNKINEFEEYFKKVRQSVFALDFETFIECFGSIYQLIGVNQNFQSSSYVQENIGTQQIESRYFFSFNLNLPARILINIEQHLQGISQHLPVRILLAQDKMGVYAQRTKQSHTDDGNEYVARNKKDFLKRLFVKKVRTKKETEQLNREKNVNKLDKDKSQSKDQDLVLGQQKSSKKDEDQHNSHHESRIYQKKKFHSLKYIIGKGQYKKKNIFKTVVLDEGTYILMVQVEGPDIKSLQDLRENVKEFNLKLVVNIFGDNLLNILQIEHPENFMRQVYESCIHHAEKKYLENLSKQLKDQVQDIRFQRSDLGDRENGSDQIIICQYYLQQEGTYLQLLDNRTDNKSWRQKLYFITENMKIIDSNENNKVDVYLGPHQDALIIIQQVRGGVYRLEGGEGICLIENIQKNVDSDENDELDDN